MPHDSTLKIANDCFKQLRHNRTCEAGKQAFEWLVALGYLKACDCCGGYHPRLASHVLGDRRNENNRFLAVRP